MLTSEINVLNSLCKILEGPARLDPIKDGYEGKNAEFYGIGEHVGEFPVVFSPSEKEIAALKERTRRPVAIVLLSSMTLGPYDLKYYQYNSLSYGYVLKEWRKACAEFMKQYGEENQVRLFEINGMDDTEGLLNKVVTFMISDLLEGRGIPF